VQTWQVAGASVRLNGMAERSIKESLGTSRCRPIQLYVFMLCICVFFAAEAAVLLIRTANPDNIV